ncbi:hypothetical protein [Rickettsia hoogstraalii]|nr:hypothetical protein [Rickettsia hoogstraalii]
MRGKIENFNEAISYQNPEIATQPTAARNDDLGIHTGDARLQ